MANRRDFAYPNGLSFLVKEADRTALNGAAKPVEFDPGVDLGCRVPVDFSDSIFGEVKVPHTGQIQLEGNATTHLYNIVNAQPRVVGEDVSAGDRLMYKASEEKFYIYQPIAVQAAQTITLATAATGGGSHTVTIGGVELVFGTGAAQSAADAATALAAAINADSDIRKQGVYATVNSAVVTLTGSRGALNNATSLVVATDDATQTIVAGGALLAGGVGYPERSACAVALKSGSANESVFVAMKVGA